MVPEERHENVYIFHFSDDIREAKTAQFKLNAFKGESVAARVTEGQSKSSSVGVATGTRVGKAVIGVGTGSTNIQSSVIEYDGKISREGEKLPPVIVEIELIPELARNHQPKPKP